MTNLSHNLAESAAMYPDQPAVRTDDEVLSYRALDRLASQLVTLLRDRGIGPAHRVGLMLPNVAQFPIAYYGILRAGAVVVPMNPLLKEREVKYYLDDSGARLLLASPEVAAEAAAGAKVAGADLLIVAPGEFEAMLAALEPATDPVSRADDDTAVLLYTSGTTGKPKGAELTHGGLNRNQAVSARTLFEIGPGDVVMGCLPLFHVFGLTCGLNTAISNGATLTLIPRFTPAKALEVIQRDRVTVFEGVPTMYAAMLGVPDRDRYDVSTLRCCVSGGAALPVEVLHNYEDAFGCIILEGYGLSESSPVAAFNHPRSERKPGSIGTPIEGVRMRLVDDHRQPVGTGEIGEIQIAGHNVMKGYWNQPEATATAIDADGWLSTGDLARQDDDGYFFIVDRKKDLLIRGGYNVYPREVEEVLYEHPAVAEAAVIGIPHPSLGEEIGAAVQLKAGSAATPEELRDHVKRRIAAYKYPRVVWIVDELPKGPTGKILRRAIEIPEGILA
ncbi:long-chain fatty acid--CoA ligase [Streptomyces sp. SID13031]|uniref:long-chain-fatty-acid--CoA ligase n=1 Tax=Streptomyces sp. SID13031 TaxID=2706046 RepID=UPI0013CA4E9F|nr:long-chain fatty acid--CoA ligase [Streptomyces sp. SID13031]NEA30582.1 long-chain fatty acid--CoA ligase [Streptomyces sp. SID13031]